MLSSLFDEYSLNARVRPALLALAPVTVFAYLAFPKLYEVLAGAVSIFVIFGLVTALAHFCRARGRAVENELYSAWDGKPTTIMLRHGDGQLDPMTKRRYHDFFEKNIDGWNVPSEEDELGDPRKADHAYESAVRWLLEYTRDRRKYSLLFKENISYGFRRNCYGIRWYAVILTVVPLIGVGVDFLYANAPLIHLSVSTALISSILSLILFFWWLLVVNENWVKDAATAYATRLLAACETDART